MEKERVLNRLIILLLWLANVLENAKGIFMNCGQLLVSKVLDWGTSSFWVCLSVISLASGTFYFYFFEGSILWCSQSSDHLEEDLTKIFLKKTYEIKNI
jgi:hypothetical protein